MLGIMGCKPFCRKDPLLTENFPPWSGHCTAHSIRALGSPDAWSLSSQPLLSAHGATVTRSNQPARKKLSAAKDGSPQHRWMPVSL